MAESTLPPKKESMFKTVQELIADGEQLSELKRYIHEGSDGGFLDASQPEMTTPLINLGLLTSSSSAAAREELEKLRSVLSSWGCFQHEQWIIYTCMCTKEPVSEFQLINHGMTDEFLNKMREMTKQFFQLPEEEKQKYSREAGSIEGYGSDIIISEHQTLDWIDRLYLTVHPGDQRKLEFWPEKPETFREIVHDYITKLLLIADELFKAMAKSLDLEENRFLDQYNGETAKMYARFNYYPPCPRPDLVLGVKPHADASAITFLLQDKEVEGLQFFKDDQWFRAPIVPQAILINIGDQVEIMSNGIFKSPVHRVVTNSKQDRISLAVFCIPDSEQQIEPVDKLVNETRPKLYKSVKNYVDLYFQYYQLGKRPIEVARI